jgi:hypothetical protein
VTTEQAGIHHQSSINLSSTNVPNFQNCCRKEDSIFYERTWFMTTPQTTPAKSETAYQRQYREAKRVKKEKEEEAEKQKKERKREYDQARLRKKETRSRDIVSWKPVCLPSPICWPPFF